MPRGREGEGERERAKGNASLITCITKRNTNPFAPPQAKDKSPQFKFRLATLILTVDIKFDNKTRVPLTSSLLTSLDLESTHSYLSFLEDSILESSESLKSQGEDEGEDSEEKKRLALGKVGINELGERCSIFIY